MPYRPSPDAYRQRGSDFRPRTPYGSPGLQRDAYDRSREALRSREQREFSITDQTGRRLHDAERYLAEHPDAMRALEANPRFREARERARREQEEAMRRARESQNRPREVGSAWQRDTATDGRPVDVMTRDGLTYVVSPRDARVFVGDASGQFVERDFRDRSLPQDVRDRAGQYWGMVPRRTPIADPAVEASPESPSQLSWGPERTENGVRMVIAELSGARYVLDLTYQRVLYWQQGMTDYRDITQSMPPAVEAKFRELSVRGAPQGAVERPQTAPGESTSSSWMRGNGFEWIQLSSGEKYAVYPDGGVKKSTRERGIEDVRDPASLPDIVRMKREENLARRAVASPEAQPSTPERRTNTINHAEAVQRLKSLSFVDKKGNVVPYTVDAGFRESYFARHSIPDARIGAYVENMTTASERLQAALKRFELPGAAVTFDGSTFTLQNGEGRMIATAAHVLWQPKNLQGTQQFRGIDGPLKDTAVTENRTSSLASRFRIFEYNDASGNRVSDHIDTEGALRLRHTTGSRGETWQRFANDGRSNNRPTAVWGSGGQIDIASSPTADTRETHGIGRGVYYVPETGKPIPRFENGKTFRSKQEKMAYRLNTTDIERTKQYADQAAKTLRTPEAITAFVTTNFTFESNRFLGAGTLRPEMEDAGQQDAQHALRTIFLGTGDCEDYALLLQYLCKRAGELSPDGKGGAKAFVGQTYENHYSAYFIEESTGEGGAKTYTLCQMHSFGLQRHGPFSNVRDALRATWRSPHSASAVDAALAQECRRPTSRTYLQHLQTLKASNDPGVVIMDKVGAAAQDVSSPNAREMIVSINSPEAQAYWQQFVRRVG